MWLALLVACTSAAVPPPAVVAADCPSWSPPEEAGRLDDKALLELSGLVPRAGGYWTHNDSGDTARIFAIDDAGHHVATVTIDGADAVDWEDITAWAPADGPRVLFVADTGDNQFVRADVDVVHFPEPAAADGRVAGTVVRYTYPDGARYNAEAVWIDPRDGALWLATKSDDGTSEVFTDPRPLEPGPKLWEHRGTLVFGTPALPGSPKVTSGDMSPDGALVGLRTYTAAYAWKVAPGQGVMDALSGPPCVIPAPKEEQGEALAFLPDGGFATVSEGKKAPLWRAKRAP